MEKGIRKLLTGIGSIACCVLQAQPGIEWQRCLGGATGDEFVRTIQETIDGGYVMIGTAFSDDGDVSGHHGGFDMWVVKLSSSGVLEWQRCLGGTSQEIGASLWQTTDGGYVVAGSAESSDGDVSGHHGSVKDAWVVKLTSTGEVEWQRCMGGSLDDEAYSVEQTADGGYVMFGYTDSSNGDVTGHHGGRDIWVVKLSATGANQWKRCLGGAGSDEARSIEQTTDGGYVVSGMTYSDDGNVSGYHGGGDVWIVKLSSTGTIEWEHCLGGTLNDGPASAQQTPDGGYIVAGSASSNDGDVSGSHGGGDVWVMKLSSTGAIEWQLCLGGTLMDNAYIMRQATDGGYFVAGYALSNNGDVSGYHGGFDLWVVKLSSTGEMEWQRCLGGSNNEGLGAFELTNDQGCVVAGSTYSSNGNVSGWHGADDGWVVKLSSSGVVEWQRCLGGTAPDHFASVLQTTDGSYLVAGTTESNGGDVSGLHGDPWVWSDVWVVELDPEAGISERDATVFTLSPNPSHGMVALATPGVHTAAIAIVNSQGAVVMKGRTAGEATSLDVSALPKGVYLLSVRAEQPAAAGLPSLRPQTMRFVVE